MNKKLVGGIFLIIIVVVAGSYFASNASLKGSVFENVAKVNSNVNDIKQLANQEVTPTDYAFVKLTTYLPPELAADKKNTPNADTTIDNRGILQGDVSSEYNSNEKGFYLVRGILQNLGTTTAPLPKVEVILNENNVSKISGMVKFGKVTKAGMEVQVNIPINSSYLKGNNTLTINLDSDNKITEAKEDNNSVSVKF